jgi:hypothetical protein
MRLVREGMREPDRRRMDSEYAAADNWVRSNPVQPSAHGMGPGSRRDILGDGWVDWGARHSAQLDAVGDGWVDWGSRGSAQLEYID